MPPGCVSPTHLPAFQLAGLLPSWASFSITVPCLPYSPYHTLCTVCRPLIYAGSIHPRRSLTVRLAGAARLRYRPEDYSIRQVRRGGGDRSMRRAWAFTSRRLPCLPHPGVLAWMCRPPSSLFSSRTCVSAHPRPLPSLPILGGSGVPLPVFGLLWSAGGAWQYGGGLRAHQSSPLRLPPAAPGPATVCGAAASGAVVRSPASGCSVRRGGCHPLRGSDWALACSHPFGRAFPPHSLGCPFRSPGARAMWTGCGARGAEQSVASGGRSLGPCVGGSCFPLPPSPRAVGGRGETTPPGETGQRQGGCRTN